MKGLLYVVGGVAVPAPPVVLDGLVPLEGIGESLLAVTANLVTFGGVSSPVEPCERDVGCVATWSDADEGLEGALLEAALFSLSCFSFGDS